MHTSRAVAVALLAAACSSVPAFRVPQVEQATQTVQKGGDRYREHKICLGVAITSEELIRCMQEHGWEFVGRQPEYPNNECWQARDQKDMERLVPPCFLARETQPPADAR